MPPALSFSFRELGDTQRYASSTQQRMRQHMCRILLDGVELRVVSGTIESYLGLDVLDNISHGNHELRIECRYDSAMGAVPGTTPQLTSTTAGSFASSVQFRLEPSSRKGRRFSRHTCTGSSFSDRSCRFEDVCYDPQSKRILYYADPHERNLPTPAMVNLHSYCLLPNQRCFPSFARMQV